MLSFLVSGDLLLISPMLISFHLRLLRCRARVPIGVTMVLPVPQICMALGGFGLRQLRAAARTRARWGLARSWLCLARSSSARVDGLCGLALARLGLAVLRLPAGGWLAGPSGAQASTIYIT